MPTTQLVVLSPHAHPTPQSTAPQRHSVRSWACKVILLPSAIEPFTHHKEDVRCQLMWILRSLDQSHDSIHQTVPKLCRPLPQNLLVYCAENWWAALRETEFVASYIDFSSLIVSLAEFCIASFIILANRHLSICHSHLRLGCDTLLLNSSNLRRRKKLCKDGVSKISPTSTFFTDMSTFFPMLLDLILQVVYRKYSRNVIRILQQLQQQRQCERRRHLCLSEFMVDVSYKIHALTAYKLHSHE